VNKREKEGTSVFPLQDYKFIKVTFVLVKMLIGNAFIINSSKYNLMSTKIIDTCSRVPMAG
jgi:hypothetical protein